MYQAILISNDGEDFVLDFHQRKTIDDVWNEINNMGSRWFSYPLCFVITDRKTAIRSHKDILNRRIIDTPEQFTECKNVTVKTALELIKNDKEFINAILS